jgi:hypothetical protein
LHPFIGRDSSFSSNNIDRFFRSEILEKSATKETNESLKNAFDRITTLPLRSAINPNKLPKDLTPRDNKTPRTDRALTSYEKYFIKYSY